MKSEPKNAHDELQCIMSRLPEEYQKITMREAMESDNPELKELKEWCIAFNNCQFINSIKSFNYEN